MTGIVIARTEWTVSGNPAVNALTIRAGLLRRMEPRLAMTFTAYMITVTFAGNCALKACRSWRNGSTASGRVA